MRLVGSDTFPALKDAFAKSRPALDPLLKRARSGIDQVAPLRDRLSREIRKHPKLAAGADAVGGVWLKLVASFCETLDPLLSRYFPDLRLVAVVSAAGEIELHKIVKGAATPLGTLAAMDPDERARLPQSKWTAIELRLRPEHVLQRTLALPAASREFLAPIIDHKLERLTPWRPDRVLYGYRTLGEGETGGSVNVALTATSKDVVAAPLQALGEAGLAPTALGPHEGSPSEPLSVNLLRGTSAGARTDSRRMVSRVALATFALLSLAWLGSSMLASNAQDAADEAGHRLIKARRLLKTASLGTIGEREKALLEGKQPEKSMVVLIAKLAKAVPEDTYLKELAVTAAKVRLVGVSSNAPALIGEVEATGLFNVRFTSAVTREKDERDTFEITADRSATGASDTAGAP